jgi:hypothetical protein
MSRNHRPIARATRSANVRTQSERERQHGLNSRDQAGWWLLNNDPKITSAKPQKSNRR